MENGTINRGSILEFRGSWSSGIGYLVFQDESGDTVSVPCENAPTVRALEACFGNVIAGGHTVAQGEEAGYYNREVFWFQDFMGMLDGFTPVEEASEELVEEYEAQEA